MRQRRKAKSPPPRKRRKLPLGLFVVLIVAASGGWLIWRNFNSTPSIPAIPHHSDPVVASQLEEGVKAVRSSPRSATAWGGLGMILHAYQFDDDARQCFSAAERLDPTEPRWPYFQGVIIQNPFDALPKLTRAVELCPSSPDTPRLRLAARLLENGRAEGAASHYETLLHSNPRHPMAVLGMARVHVMQGNLARATDYLRRCLEDPFAASKAYLLLATVQQTLGNTPAAEAARTFAANLPPDQSWPEPFTDEILRLRIGQIGLVRQAERLLKANRHTEAQEPIQRLLAQYPDAPEAHLLTGRLNLERKDCRRAETDFREHLKLAPESVNGYVQLGLALLCQERYAEAIVPIEAAIRLKPDLAEAHFNHGFALARAKRGREAIQAFRNAIRCSPEHLDAYILAGDLLSQSGETAEATALLKKALELAPNDQRAKALLDRMQEAR